MLLTSKGGRHLFFRRKTILAHKLLVRIANREDTSEAVCSGSALSMAFLMATGVRSFRWLRNKNIGFQECTFMRRHVKIMGYSW